MSSASQPLEHPAAPAVEDTLSQDAQGLARSAELSAPRLVPPAVVPGYDVQRRLGAGAYGSVWLASERNTGKQVAIKFYSHRRGLDWSLLNREVEKLAVLYTSRDIVGLLQVGWDSDPPYYVMEFLQNGSLSRLLDQGPLPVSDAVRIATAVANALVHAHQQGILHCDVKPANVLLDGDFAPRLADFGQSRLSHEQNPALGTLFYMAPEQADLDAIPDPRWDVYALGALLYHMLCGEPPCRTPENERIVREAGTLEEKLAAYRRIVREGPRPAQHRKRRGVDARLAEIVDRCLAPDPARRFRSVAEVANALSLRARFRSLRPTIALGVILPGLLLLALLPLAVKAVNDAAATAEVNIAQRAIESDAVAAKILASSLNDDLEQRRTTLSKIADWPELAPLMVGASAPPESEARRKLVEYLAADKASIDKRNEELGSDLDESWFLTDAHGVQVWRDPPKEASLEQNYSWRDYFHGQGEDREDWKGRTDVKPLDKPHISVPYRSTATDELKIALSAPVFDAERKQVLGVLGRSIRLGRFLGSYKQIVGEEWRGATGERVIALLDIRREGGCVLDHPWMTPENLNKLKGPEVFDRLTLWPPQHRELEKLRQLVRDRQPVGEENRDRIYYDPVRKADADAEREYGMPWLAAFWPVGDTGWVAVVQEKRDDALRPVREIRQGFIRYGLAGALLCLTLAGTSWYFVARIMRAQRKALRRRPGNGLAAAEGTASSR